MAYKTHFKEFANWGFVTSEIKNGFVFTPKEGHKRTVI